VLLLFFFNFNTVFLIQLANYSPSDESQKQISI